MAQEEVLQNGMMPVEEENSNFDLMEWVICILHHWYLFVIAAVIAFSLAYLNNNQLVVDIRLTCSHAKTLHN